MTSSLSQVDNHENSYVRYVSSSDDNITFRQNYRHESEERYLKMERYYKERDEEHKKDQARLIEENKKLKRLIDENQAKLLKCLKNDNDSDTVNKDNKKGTKTKNKSINMDGDIVSPIEEAVLTATSQNPIHRQRMFDNQYSQFEYERNMVPQSIPTICTIRPSLWRTF